MSTQKASVGMFGLVIIGIVIIGIVLLLHSIPIFQKVFKIGSEGRIYLTISDQTSNIVPLLSSEWEDVKATDAFACMASSSDCDIDGSHIDSSAREMRSMVVLYATDGTSTKFGSDNNGDMLQVTMPLPSGERSRLAFILPISLSSTSELDREKRLRYGDCKAIGSSEYVRLYLTRIDFLGRDVLVNRLAEADFLAVDKEVKECTDPETLNYDFWRKEDLDASGTYACRENVNFPGILSMHAYGLAVDINPSANPNCPKDSQCKGQNILITDIPQCVIDAFKRNNFIWGGDFISVKDSMHFEWKDPNVYTISDAVKYASEEKRGDEI